MTSTANNSNSPSSNPYETITQVNFEKWLIDNELTQQDFAEAQTIFKNFVRNGKILKVSFLRTINFNFNFQSSLKGWTAEGLMNTFKISPIVAGLFVGWSQSGLYFYNYFYL